MLAKRVDGIRYQAVLGRASRKVPARIGPKTSMKAKGKLSKGAVVSVRLRSRYKGAKTWWDKVLVNGKYRYVIADSFDEGEHLRLRRLPEVSWVPGILSEIF